MYINFLAAYIYEYDCDLWNEWMMATGLPLAFSYPDQQLQTPPVYKWRLVLSYDGNRFSGWCLFYL